MGIYVILTIFSLVKIGDRPIQNISLTSEQKKEIKMWEKDKIVDNSLSMTCDMLTFSKKNEISHGKANCVGYAQFYSAICNYAFQTHHVNGKAKPVVGYIKIGGLNICNIAQHLAPNKKWKNFTKDHDFVEVTINGKTKYIDPSIYDFF